jgi:hypothetical protein
VDAAIFIATEQSSVTKIQCALNMTFMFESMSAMAISHSSRIEYCEIRVHYQSAQSGNTAAKNGRIAMTDLPIKPQNYEISYLNSQIVQGGAL